jgi:cholesterol oxidase
MQDTFDFVVIGSGFGGSVSAMRLTEKGYRVLVLERGKRFRDQDFPKTNWNIFKFLWLPALRCFGIMELTTLKGVLVLHGSGVGGGSLVYANVLMKPSDKLFEAPAWRDLADWKTVLEPHYQTARRMLGVTTNPRLWPADDTLHAVADDLKRGDTFRPVEVGVFFGDDTQPGEPVPDPFFGGEGPDRATCRHCGGCMVGCRYNAKNTLVKNYLYFAEKNGAQVRAEAQVSAIRPLPDGQPDGARYEITTTRATALVWKRPRRVRARNVILAAGVLGTLDLLYRCRDDLRTLPDISPRLGTLVRTNSEALLGVTARDDSINYADGVAITSIFQADDITQVEPVRYPVGSGFIKLLAAPMIDAGSSVPVRFLKTLAATLRHPLDHLLKAKLLPRWARSTTILLVMWMNYWLQVVARIQFELLQYLPNVCYGDSDVPQHNLCASDRHHNGRRIFLVKPAKSSRGTLAGFRPDPRHSQPYPAVSPDFPVPSNIHCFCAHESVLTENHRASKS